MKWSWVGLLAALAVTFVCHADEGDGVRPKCNDAYGPGYRTSVLDLLDPATPADRRAAAVEGYLRASALAHCTGYMHTLGQLYRHGPELPGNLLPQDTAKAHDLLLRSAEAGHMSAYADLAEMALREGDAREAMKWTQVYLYFVKNVEKTFLDRERARFHSAGYNGDLLLRAERAWRKARPRLDRKLIGEDLSGYVTQDREEVAEHIHDRMTKTREGMTTATQSAPQVKSVGACKPAGMRGISAAMVVYVVEVLPSGRIGRVLPESFSPDPVVVERLAHCARVYEYEPFDGERPRIVRIPVMYGYSRGDFVPSFKL